MKIFFLLSVALLLLPAITFCQSDSIQFYNGYVLNNGKALPSVSVVAAATKKGVLTNREGFFKIPKTTGAKMIIHFSAVGYQHLAKEIQGTQTQADTIELQPLIAQLDDVVVSGTMKAISKMDSPIPVEVYTPALFKKNPSPNIFESLQMVNGVQPQLNCNVCNTGDIHINGMEGPYTMILIDGMPIVSSLSTVYGLAGIPNSLIKRVEIVKGPASTLYGSEAVGGLINIITKDPLNSEKLKVDLSSTSIGEYNTDITTGFKLKTASSVIGINYFNYWNKRDINNDNFTDVTLQNRFSIFNKWNFKTLNNRIATLAARYVFENRWGGELQWNKNYRGTGIIYGESILTNRYELIGKYELSNNLSADLSYNYHHQDSYYGTTKYDAVQHVAFGQFRWNKALGKHDLLIGVPFRMTYYDDNSPATATSTKNKPAVTYLPGIFVQDEFKSSQKLTTLLGLRYDYNNLHGSILTPRLSFKFSPDANNTIRLSGGNGYRVVNLFTEDHAALTGARQVVIASALKPEQSWNINLNYTRQAKWTEGFVNLDASLFYTYFTNKIVGDFITDPTKIIYDNLKGHAISKGFTLNTDIAVSHRFKINAGITLMDVYQTEKDTLGRALKIPQLFAPSFSGTYAVSYSIPRYAIAIDWTGKVNGSMYLPVVPNDFRPEKSPLYCIMNLQVTKTFLKGWEVYGGVKNLLGFLPKNPLLHPDDPFNKPGGKYFDSNGKANPLTNPYGYVFDPSYNFAPVQGAKGFLGLRYTLL